LFSAVRANPRGAAASTRYGIEEQCSLAGNLISMPTDASGLQHAVTSIEHIGSVAARRL
jgi:hypothetical protein